MLGYKSNIAIVLLGLTSVLFSCSKDEPQYVYEVQEVSVDQAGAEKPNVKTSTEYISIAYSDAFGSNISNNLLNDLKKIYIAFGDVGVTEDLIIRNFLNGSGVELPTTEEMNSDINEFVVNAYKKVYNRFPNEYEQWFLENLITEEDNVTPEVVYYALMTSNEYRQY